MALNIKVKNATAGKGGAKGANEHLEVPAEVIASLEAHEPAVLEIETDAKAGTVYRLHQIA